MHEYLPARFTASRKAFEELLAKLAGADAAKLEHGEVESLVSCEGTELMRLLVQDHLSLRALRSRESLCAMEGADREVRGQVRHSKRTLGTLFGDVEVLRPTLVQRGVPGGLCPLDAELNMPKKKYSHGVRTVVASEVVKSSYDDAVAAVRNMTGAKPAKRQVEELAMEAAEDFGAFYEERGCEPTNEGDLLILSFDGAGLLMRPEALRPETQRRAKRSRKRSTAETAAMTSRRSQQKHRKRLAQVATVYELEAVSRSAGDIDRELRRAGPYPVRPRPKNKRVRASVERSMPEVLEEAFVEAARRDPDFRREWVVVVDGNKQQIKTCRALAQKMGVKITIVLDVIHVLGYLWKAGKALLGAKPKEIEEWVSERTRRILQGKGSAVAGGMRRSATNRKLKSGERKSVDACARYLLNNTELLRYDRWLPLGYPIASGVIEGACRSLVRQRMDISGARWGLKGAEAVLKLRSLKASGDLDEYLAFVAKTDLERNHLRRYSPNELPRLRANA